MTIVAANWVGENTATVGTGPLTLSGAISTFCPFSVLPDGSEVYYTLQEGFNRETGIGVVHNGTLTRNVQATLVAGVYTETDIPISLVGNGQVFAVINADFMTRIYNFSLDVADSVTAAAASSKSAADSAAFALASKTAAWQSALAAKDSENNAKTSETNAKASETAANSAKTDAQTANVQTQGLYNQTVDLVAGVQAPDKLPASPGSSSAWMKIANVKNAGLSTCFAQFIIGGGANYGSQNLPVDIFSISGSGLPDTLTSNNIDANFTQCALIPASNSMSRLKLGVVKNTDGSFDVYLLSPNGNFPVMWLNRLNVQSNNGLITGPIIDRTGYSWITTEPAGIVYNSQTDYLMANNRTIPRTNVANTFSQPQVISSTLLVNGSSNLCGGVDVTASQGLPLKETTATNGIGVNFIGNNETECSFGIENTSGGSAVFHNYTRGANNAASYNGQLIGGYGSRPWDGSAYTEHSNVSQHFLQDGTCSARNHGGWFRLLTTPLNKTNADRRQTLATSNNGDLYAGYDVPMGLYSLSKFGGFIGLEGLDGRGFKQINNTANELILLTPRNGNTANINIRGVAFDGTAEGHKGATQLGDNMWVSFAGHNGTSFTNAAAGIRIQAYSGWDKSNSQCGIVFATTHKGSNVRIDRWAIATDGNLSPEQDNVYHIGSAISRCAAIWSANGAIQTSDARLKSEVRKFTDNEIAAAKLLSQEIGIYSWLAKQAEEGEDAREHIGLTVQRAIEIMESCGLDPMHYGFICYDEWEEEDIIIGYEDDVNPIMGKKEAGDRYSFRYDQLNLFIARGIEARLSAIEDKLWM